MPTPGPLELVIILGIILLIFGPKKLPGLGRSLGTSMREFKDSITGSSKDDERAELESSDGDGDDDEPSTAKRRDDAVSRPRG